MAGALVPIIPKSFDLSGLPVVLSKANKRFAINEKRSFMRTVQTWTNKPKFVVEKTHTIMGVDEYEVYTDDQVYKWVNDGTDPHKISGNPTLKYQGDFSPKTSPDNIGARQGGKSGHWVIKSEVDHPGITPRDFVGQIKKKASGRWSRALDRELEIWVKTAVR